MSAFCAIPGRFRFNTPLHQFRRCDGGDRVHVVPQDSGHSGSVWLLLLDAVLLLHRRKTAVRDDRPVRPPDVQPDMSILVRQLSFLFLSFSDSMGRAVVC